MSDHIKYPKTYHLPFSLGITNEDKVLKVTSHFNDKIIVATVKYDGECTTLYSDYVHARSVDFSYHPSRTWVKSLQGKIGYKIPEGFRISGENLYAQHSIHYKHLRSYFYVFSVWNNKNECLSWDDTTSFCKELDLPTVPILYEGIWNEKLIRGLYTPKYMGDDCEGFVVRTAESFHYNDFINNVSKFVRPNHVQTDEHWMLSAVINNELEGQP